VAAAYDRDAGGVQRNAATDAERDLTDAALDTRKDELLARITASGLPADSELARGLARKIRDASSVHRLDGLDGLLDEVLIITAELVDDDDDDDDDVVYCYDAAGRLVPAILDGPDWVPAPRLTIVPLAALPAPPRLAVEAPRRAAASFTAALAARDAAMEPNQEGRGLCHVIWPPPPGAPRGTPRRHCLGQGRHPIPGGAICDACLDALQVPLAVWG